MKKLEFSFGVKIAMTKKFAILFFLILNNITFAQIPTIVWQKSFGGNERDGANSIKQTKDEGFIIAGYTASNNMPNYHGGYDFLIVKLDLNGNLEWQKCFGGTSDDVAFSVDQVTDSGYVITGYTMSTDGDVSNNHGISDFWVIKLDYNGNLLWGKCLGGSGDDMAYSINKTTDGGCVVAGYSNSNDGDITNSYASGDYWVIKLNSVGDLQWEKSLGGTNDDWAHCIKQTTDNNYVIAGNSSSDDGDVFQQFGAGDFWLIKLINHINSLEELSKLNFESYPNPFQNFIKINVVHDDEILSIKLSNLLGQVILKTTTNKNTKNLILNTEKVSIGIYLLQIKTNNNQFFEILVKQ